MITGKVIGGRLLNPDTIILVDENGKEYPMVMLGEETELTATTDDVRLGKTVALPTGVETGEKFIPSYHTNEGMRVVMPGSKYTIPVLVEQDAYDFTKLQALICSYNTSVTDSVSTNKVSIDGVVYDVLSINPLSSVIKQHDVKSVDLGIANDTDTMQVLRYFTYKEI